MEKPNTGGKLIAVSNCWTHAVTTLSGDTEDVSGPSCSPPGLTTVPIAGIGLGCAAASAFVTALAFFCFRRWRRRRIRVHKELALTVQPGPAPPYVHQYPELTGSKGHSAPHAGGTWSQHPGTPMSLPSHIIEPHQQRTSTLELPATPIESSNDIWQGPGKAEVPVVGKFDPPSDQDLSDPREDTLQPLRHLSPSPAPRRARSREPEFEMVTKQSIGSLRDEVSSEKGN